jgi:hypothetical protein
VKKTREDRLANQILLSIIPTLMALSVQTPLLAQVGAGPTGLQTLPNAGESQATAPSVNQPGTPALNVMPTITRPPLPPPPETPQTTPAIVQQLKAQTSMPQAWRIKALQLFKAGNSMDKSSILAMHIQTSYARAFEAITRALADSGLTLEALSFSSGHMLLSSQNDRGQLDKAIIALRQSAPASTGSASCGTEVRVFCDSHNHALTLAQVKAILSQVDLSVQSSKNKAGAETL